MIGDYPLDLIHRVIVKANMVMKPLVKEEGLPMKSEPLERKVITRKEVDDHLRKTAGNELVIQKGEERTGTTPRMRVIKYSQWTQSLVTSVYQRGLPLRSLYLRQLHLLHERWRPVITQGFQGLTLRLVGIESGSLASYLDTQPQVVLRTQVSFHQVKVAVVSELA